MAWIHPFEKSELGKAPFRFVCAISLPPRSLLEANPSAYNSAMGMAAKEAKALGARLGTCYHCGMALMNNFIIEDCNKVRSTVGCDCVMKVGASDPGLVKAVQKAEKVRKKARKELTHKMARKKKRADFFKEHRATLELAWKGRRTNKFLLGLIKSFLSYGSLTDRQLNAIPESIERLKEQLASAQAEAKRKEGSSHIGKVGQRIELELTCIFRFNIDTFYGPGAITILRDASGNSFKTTGVCRLEKGETKRLKFTVKGHQEYKGEKQTIITRLVEA